MRKMTPNSIKKLILKGRLQPIITPIENGKYVLVGYRRKSTSRKAKDDAIMLSEPEEINPTDYNF